MSDHRLFSGDNYQIFSKTKEVEEGIGRILVTENQFFEGQTKNLKPNGFGRMIYKNEYTQTKCIVGFFENGQPNGKVIKFTMVEGQDNKVALETQGKVRKEQFEDVTNIDRVELDEELITNFGGEDVATHKIVPPLTKDEEEVDEMIVEKLRSIALDEQENIDVLEDDQNILQLTPFNFDQSTKDATKDVLICIYNSDHHDEVTDKMLLDYQNIAIWFKEEEPAPNLICACFDRGTFDIPTISAKEQEKIEITTKGRPYWMYFPMENKAGKRYGFEETFEGFKMFLRNKSTAVKQAIKGNEEK